MSDPAHALKELRWSIEQLCADLMAPQVYQALLDAKIARSRESVVCLLMIAVEELRAWGMPRDSVLRLVDPL